MHPSHTIWLNLCTLSGLGASRLGRLAEAFDAAGNIDDSLIETLLAELPTGLRRSVSQIFHQPSFDSLCAEAQKAAAWVEQEDNYLLALIQPEYPALLRLLDDPPPLLFLRGQVDLLYRPQLAIVGSRNPSAQGVETARQFARALGEGGFTVTSGLAAGIDGAAHQGAVGTLGSTVAVMGSGIDVVYPARHRTLAEQLCQSGLLVSELWPNTPPMAQHFPRRNRIISGLSLGTIVVEASMRSGSLITARTALEQHREVFAIPGSIHNPQARGCHHLIKQGAKLVESTDDILVELPALMRFYQQQQSHESGGFSSAAPLFSRTHSDLTSSVPSEEAEVDDPHFQMPQPAAVLTKGPDDDPVYLAVGYELTHTDQIVERTGIAVAEVQTRLMQLELEGVIRSDRGGFIRMSA